MAGVNIGGYTISQASSVLTINTGTTATMRVGGSVARQGQPLFIAVGPPGGDWTYPADGWGKPIFPTVDKNIGGCYSASTNRFTCPLAGHYFFEASCWLLKDGANNNYYFHPAFAFNGNPITLRLRLHGAAMQTYSDSQVSQIVNLNPGDYVEHWIYSIGYMGLALGNRWHAAYCRFTGFFLG